MRGGSWCDKEIRGKEVKKKDKTENRNAMRVKLIQASWAHNDMLRIAARWKIYCIKTTALLTTNIRTLCSLNLLHWLKKMNT